MAGDRRAHRHVGTSGVAPIGATPPYDAVIFDLDGVVTDASAVAGDRGVRVFTGTVALVRRLRAGGVPTGLVTAAPDIDALLAAADLEGLFDVIVDGARRGGVGGGPDAALFLEAARRLGVAPGRVAVVDDTPEGVGAARRGGFALAVGVDRLGRREVLEAAGADLVVQDVEQLDLGALRADPWSLVYEGFDPAHEGHREALTTLGNGYMGTRGAAPERAADGVHYPGTYLAGVYNRLTSTVHGRQVEDEQIVNAPNWLLLDVQVEGGEWWSGGGLITTRSRRELDLRHGVLSRRVDLADAAGRRLEITQRRLVSMARPHVAALETVVVARGWSGRVAVRSGVDAGVTNANVAEYALLQKRHLRGIAVRLQAADLFAVEADTSQSGIRIAVAARTSVAGAGPPGWDADARRHRYAHRFDLSLRDGAPVVIDKVVAVCTSRDVAISSPVLGAVDELDRAPRGFDRLLSEHEAMWRRLWDRFSIGLDADREVQLVLNLHVFHLLQTISPHTAALDAGVPARGLHGEGYRGHVFWDELFVLPAVATHLPEVARALLAYRWRRLDAA
ncbi:MAG TPA: HAD-IA family hydrolase, partial [Acidimicrobiales bacterium]|nr:HAD-IA family hydrolase [Acidimicrobiales bacterium]